MSPHPTQSYVGRHRPSLTVPKVIELRRWSQGRGQGRNVLATGETIGFLPYRECAIRVRYRDDDMLDLHGCHGPLPETYELCGQLQLPWGPIGGVYHRWRPTLEWTDKPWFDDQGAQQLAVKAVGAYYHVLKGYRLDPDDHVLANPEPTWISAATPTT